MNPNNPNLRDMKIYLQVKPALYDLERKLIRQAMEEAQGNQSLAARYCGLSRSTLIHKLKQYETDTHEEIICSQKLKT